MIRDLLCTKSKASHIFVVFLLDFSPPLSPRLLGHPAFVLLPHLQVILLRESCSYFVKSLLLIFRLLLLILCFQSPSTLWMISSKPRFNTKAPDSHTPLPIECLHLIVPYLPHPHLPYPKCSSSHFLKLDRTWGAIDSQHPCRVNQPSPVDSRSLSSHLSIFIPLDLDQPLLYLQEYRSRLALRLGAIT